MTVLICKRCGYEWQPRKQAEEIKRCPDCLSKLWNVKKNPKGLIKKK